VELGLLLGIVFKPQPKPIADADHAHENQEPTIPELNLRFALPDAASSIDTLIRCGNYQAALARCQASSAVDSANELRTAIVQSKGAAHAVSGRPRHTQSLSAY
jgi:hypothetical protein